MDAQQLNIAKYMENLASAGKSSATISRNLASLKNFYNYLTSSGFLEKAPVIEIHIQRKRRSFPRF